ncbi:MAG: Xaa-Pro dipeptidase [Silanimonas sp.]|nr:MAG: Xaa-Pro dipeptidase [Silanimonas sp.]
MSSLYAEHLAILMQRADAALAKAGFDHLLIASGVEKYQFLDDRPYPFKPNPHFRHWVPLQQHPHSWIAYTPGQRPVLVYHQPDDYWHVPPAPPEGAWVEHFDIRLIREPQEAAAHLPRGRAAIVGEADAALEGVVPNNPPVLLNALHYQRGFKTAYELDRMRRAQRRAVKGHRAAEAAFRAGGSEREIHRAYLEATGHSDLDLPYTNIIGLNQHAAVLHYQYQSPERPAKPLSFLIDAGAEVDGYASDITRTYAMHEGVFADLIAAVDAEQQALCRKVRSGVDYRDLHLECHLRLGGVLRSAGIVDMDPGEMVAEGVTSVFFPHGLGHPIGLQVHDVAGRHDEEGNEIPRPAGHPYLRTTRTLAPGMVVTIEPGLYFIPLLLERLKAGPQAKHVDWTAIEALLPYGGIRIEDEVACTDGEPENLTREAFADA